MKKDKEYVLGLVSDCCLDLTYYNRKQDSEFTPEDLEEAVKNGVVTIDEMVEEFRKNLEETFK